MGRRGRVQRPLGRYPAGVGVGARDGAALGHVGQVGNIDYAEAHEGYPGKTAGFSVSAETKELIEDEVEA